MNELSWLLYLAELSESLATIFVIIGFVLLVATVFLGIMSFQYREEYHSSDDHNKSVRLRCRRYAIGFGIICFILLIFAAVLPSKNTVYAIAASEMGEHVLDSKTGSLATQALNSWLQKQITSPGNK